MLLCECLRLTVSGPMESGLNTRAVNESSPSWKKCLARYGPLLGRMIAYTQWGAAPPSPRRMQHASPPNHAAGRGRGGLLAVRNLLAVVLVCL